jgi:hypothetical protein
LFNSAAGKFGPAKKLGSSGVLSSGGAQIFLATSRVRADGPGDPSVELDFDIRFTASARRRHFEVEVAASDDLGHAQPFKLAGVLDVIGATSSRAAKSRRIRR